MRASSARAPVPWARDRASRIPHGLPQGLPVTGTSASPAYRADSCVLSAARALASSRIRKRWSPCWRWWPATHRPSPCDKMRRSPASIRPGSGRAGRCLTALVLNNFHDSVVMLIRLDHRRRKGTQGTFIRITSAFRKSELAPSARRGKSGHAPRSWRQRRLATGSSFPTTQHRTGEERLQHLDCRTGSCSTLSAHQFPRRFATRTRASADFVLEIDVDHEEQSAAERRRVRPCRRTQLPSHLQSPEVSGRTTYL